MRYRVLGPLEVTDIEGRPLDVGGAKPRALLTLLLAEANRVVGIDRIVATLWGDEPPPTVTGTLQAYVSNLRRVLEPARGPREAPAVLLTRPPGYLLMVDPGELDSLRFAELVDEGDRAVESGDPDDGIARLDEALRLWRGQPLAELGDTPSASTDRHRLGELHVRARERRCDALLAAGRAEAAVTDLQRLVTEHPLRERLWARLVTALYAANRQADALDACRRCAELLREELGIDPGPELRDLEQAVLRQDAKLLQRLPRPRLPSSPVTAPSAPPPSAAAEIVGRHAELGHLRRVAEQVATGRPGIVILEGEAGIGKTRLAEAAAEIAGAEGYQVAWCRCADDAGAPMLWPWVQALEQLGLEELPGIDIDAEADADAARFRLFQELRRRLAGAATRRRPILVVLDDLQGADTTSVQLLGLLGRHLPRVPLLIGITVRTVGEDLPPAVTDCLARLAREPFTARLKITGLGADEVSTLLSVQLGRPGDRTLAAAVHDRTAGNPFFVVELSRWMLGAHDVYLDRVPVPPSVEEVLRKRLSRLPAEALDVLRLAAVAGREVTLDLLEAAGTPAEDALAALDSAVAIDLVVSGSTPWGWRFSHALVQEVLEGDLSALQRARLHARLGTALEQRSGGAASDALVERLAHHFVNAVPVTGPGPARRYATAAARAARSRLAYGEAAEHTRCALQLVHPDEPDAARTRHDLLTALGNDLLRSGQRTDAHGVIAEAIEVARQLGDRQCVARSAAVWGSPTLWNWRPHGVVDHDMVALLQDLIDHPEELTDSPEERDRLTAELLGTLGIELAFSEDLQRGVRAAEQAVTLARALGEAELLGRTVNNYCLAVWGRPGAAELRLAATDEALAMVGTGLPRRTEFFARLHRAAIKLHLTDLAGFEADLEAGRRLAFSLGGPEVRPHVLWQQAGAAWLRGNSGRAEELTTEAYELYRRVTPHARHAFAAHQFALRRGDHRLPEAIDLLVETGDEGNPLLQLMAVVAAGESGDLAEARRLRARWGRTPIRDWASDVAVLLQAEAALLLDDEPELETAVVQMLPFRGRQAVLGTPALSLGAYDELLGRIAEHRGDLAAAREWWEGAKRQGRLVGCPHQVALAQYHLDRVGRQRVVAMPPSTGITVPVT